MGRGYNANNRKRFRFAFAEGALDGAIDIIGVIRVDAVELERAPSCRTGAEHVDTRKPSVETAFREFGRSLSMKKEKRSPP
jgi:hypothetical protein